MFGASFLLHGIDKWGHHHDKCKVTVRELLHLWYFSLWQKQQNKVTSFSVNQSKCDAVLWVPLCARSFPAPLHVLFYHQSLIIGPFYHIGPTWQAAWKVTEGHCHSWWFAKRNLKLDISEAETELLEMWKLEPKTMVNLIHVWFCSHDSDDKSNKWKAEIQRFMMKKRNLILSLFHSRRKSGRGENGISLEYMQRKSWIKKKCLSCTSQKSVYSFT